jgi:cbb3-type cytochrome oxidase maturation protein
MSRGLSKSEIDPHVTLTALAIVLVAALLGATAVAALVWAVKDRQFEDFPAGARSIFDDEEPIGEMTDAFPGAERSASTPGNASS